MDFHPAVEHPAYDKKTVCCNKGGGGGVEIFFLKLGHVGYKKKSVFLCRFQK
jgi:hypothetical protein